MKTIKEAQKFLEKMKDEVYIVEKRGEMYEKKCPACKGEGKKPPFVCMRCAGRGKVSAVKNVKWQPKSAYRSHYGIEIFEEGAMIALNCDNALGKHYKVEDVFLTEKEAIDECEKRNGKECEAVD